MDRSASGSFGGGRPTESGEHHRWEKLSIRVKADDSEK
jgi:hypothetical protein